MKYLFLALYIIVSIIHLRDSFNNNEAKRKETKPFLLFLLLIYYLSSTSNISYTLVLALLTSWIGDILLMTKGHKWFVLGGISFMFCHLFFIFVFLTRISLADIKWHIVIPILLIYLIISLIIILKVSPSTPKKMIIPMYFYLIMNSLMNIFAFMLLMSNKDIYSLIAYIGAILFFISDCLLFLVRYYKDPDVIYKKHFPVMFTYLLGELLITIGIMFIH